MTIEQKRKILEKIVQLESDIEEMKKARLEVIQTGFSSATLASSGGSKSYTRIDVDKMTSTIRELLRELAQLRDLLAGGSGLGSKQIYHIYF